MEKNSVINVCVCTYLRSEHLEKCLTSLIHQTAPEGASYFITVIDNDKERSAESIVSNLQARGKVEINYVCEKNRGIPYARNRALDESCKLNSDYIAFIDDDERASCDWLSTLYSYLKSYNDQTVVAHGRVVPDFPAKMPSYLCESFYSKKFRPTGTQLRTCATNNVLFPVALAQKYNLQFDTTKPFAGGTDTKFFFEAYKKGISIYECSEAVVKETIFRRRLRLSWVMHRKYRAGITDAWRQIQMGNSKFSISIKATSRVLWHSIFGCVLITSFNPAKCSKQFVRTARSVGILAGLTGIETDSYVSVDNK